MDESYEQRRDELDLGDLVGRDGGEESGHTECWEDGDGCFDHEGEGLEFDDAGDVVEWEKTEDGLVVG